MISGTFPNDLKFRITPREQIKIHRNHSTKTSLYEFLGERRCLIMKQPLDDDIAISAVVIGGLVRGPIQTWSARFR
jgi:hypothetical protein